MSVLACKNCNELYELDKTDADQYMCFCSAKCQSEYEVCKAEAYYDSLKEDGANGYDN